MRLSLILGLSILTGVSTAFAAGEKRDLSAHEHGVGKLNIAFEKGEIAMELEAPGADIVESHPRSHEGPRCRAALRASDMRALP